VAGQNALNAARQAIGRVLVQMRIMVEGADLTAALVKLAELEALDEAEGDNFIYSSVVYSLLVIQVVVARAEANAETELDS